MVKSKTRNTIYLVGAIASVLAIILAVGPSAVSWLQGLFHSNGGPICNVTQIPTKSSYSTVFYNQGEVFCIPRHQAIVQNFSTMGYTNLYGINGSYSASANTEFYVLNSIQYGEFIVLKNKITNYTWYSGNNQGKTINATGLTIGGNYYVVFYTNSSSLDTITIVRSIQASFRYP